MAAGETKMPDGGARPGNGHEDPLLVRRFVLHPDEADDTSEPGHTWPAPPRHVPAHRAREIERTALVLPGTTADDDTIGTGPSRRRVLLIAGLVVLVALALAVAGIGVINGGGGGPRALPTASAPGAPIESAPGTASVAPGATAPGSTSAAPGGSGQPGPPEPGQAGPGSGTEPAAGPGSGTTTGQNGPAAAALDISRTMLASTAASSPPAEPRTGAIRTDDNRCLSLPGGKPRGHNKYAQVATCDGSDGQTWTLDPDGTVRLGGKCALAEDTAIRISGCGNRPEAQWRAGSGGILLNVSTGWCLTDRGDAVIAECTGAADQRWTLQ